RIDDVEPDQESGLGLDLLAGLHSARSAPLLAPDSGRVLGVIGEVDPDVASALGLPHARIGWLQLDVAALAGALRRSPLAAPVSKYPSSDVDLAFVVDEGVPARRIESALRRASDLCESVELFDVYRGAAVGEGRRSLAYRVRLRALDKTLSDVDVAAARQA